MIISSSLSDEQVGEFIGLYEKEFGINLSFEKAKEEALKLFGLYQIIYLERQYETTGN